MWRISTCREVLDKGIGMGVLVMSSDRLGDSRPRGTTRRRVYGGMVCCTFSYLNVGLDLAFLNFSFVFIFFEEQQQTHTFFTLVIQSSNPLP